MVARISVADVYDKNLSFLIGSGASHGLYPTLALNIKNSSGEVQTIESLATEFEDSQDRRLALFMHYYETCILPAQNFDWNKIRTDAAKQHVLANYEAFVRTILGILNRRGAFDRRCNIFTTNYDGCFQFTADKILSEGHLDFVLNDGSRGFMKKHLHPRNFNTYLHQTGIFERHSSSVPQINLVHLHGSIYWQRDGASIVVDYRRAPPNSILSTDTKAKLAPFSAILDRSDATIDDLPALDIEADVAASFWNSYQELPIVNPTKWKFHETVFEEHYYQMLRMLSYELEKPNSVLITFGFSFADEHILNLIERSLSNPSLQVFVCCFNEEEEHRIAENFKMNQNVAMVRADDGLLDFASFNQNVFSLSQVNNDVAPPVGAP